MAVRSTISRMSAPAEKNRSVPNSAMQRMAGSLSASRTAASSFSHKGAFKGLPRLGLPVSRTMRTAPRVSVAT